MTPPTWTSEPPAVPGFYWFRSEWHGLTLLTVVEVDGGRVWGVGRADSLPLADITPGRWAGPIPEPAEPTS